MAWTVEFAPSAQKTLRKLDRTVAGRIIQNLEDVAQLDHPHDRGAQLTGKLAGLWRYRIGDWRAVVRFEQDRVVILVLEVGHRREIYRRS